MNFRICALLACLAALPAAAGPSPDPASGALVEVLVTCQTPHARLPWQQDPPGTRRGYGVTVGPAFILTTETLVRNQRLVEWRAARSGHKVSAAVCAADPQVNLALLETTPPDPAALLAPADPAVPHGPLRIFQFDATRELQSGSGRIVQVAMDALPDAPYSSLTFTLATELDINGEGAPVLSGDRLAGLIMRFDRSRRQAQIAPAAVIARFLEAATASPYTGFAAAGFAWKPLVDPARRRYLRVPAAYGGVLVVSALPGSGAAASLQPNDVVVSWDGYAVDRLGYYEDPAFGRLAFPYLIKGRRKPGELATAALIRDGLLTNVVVRLAPFRDADALIPENVIAAPAPYFVEGGLVFREVTGRYLKAGGPSWQRANDARLVHAYLTRQLEPEQPGDRLVIVSQVLPDPINIGYRRLDDMRVERINGTPVRNLADLFRIAERDGHISRIGLQDSSLDFVLDAAGLDTANARIQRLYGIPALRRPAPTPDTPKPEP
ncbi:MAG: hypothetical protein JW951_00210 [Lentisphaerae bacterium]|nr:hypothetical protein [Lentisphaerota bacterium]